MRRRDAGSVMLLALCGSTLFFGLSRVPAMSSDESWTALFALRLLARGAYTIHAMNRYTGPLYSWAVGAFLRTFGVSLAALRLPGPICNAAAGLGAWQLLRRRCGAEAGFFWCLLAAGSAFWFTKSRLASEVLVLQPLLLTATAFVITRTEAPGAAAALSALCWLGVQNHFIYLCVPLSLVLMFGVRSAWRAESSALHGLRASAAALAASAVLVAVKLKVSDVFWEAHQAVTLAGVALAPALAAWGAAMIPMHFWRGGAGLLDEPRARRCGQALCAAGLVGFAIWHLVPMIQVLAGSVVFKRMFSWPPPMILSAPWHLWGAALCAWLAWNAVRAWNDPALPPQVRTFLLWPAALCAVLVLLRQTSSQRYYSIPVWIAFIALGASFSLLADADKRIAVFCALAMAATTQTFLWREWLHPQDRRPLEFKMGWRRESSVDFARKDALLEAFDASGACTAKSDEPAWAQGPVTFRHVEQNHPCDHSIVFRLKPAPESEAPPYFRWWTEPVPAPGR